MKFMPSRAEAGIELRDQAASCRRLALSARTIGGSEALKAVADQFDLDAARVDPLPAVAGDGMTAQGASLIRVREALERQTAHWLQRGRASDSPKGAA